MRGSGVMGVLVVALMGAACTSLDVESLVDVRLTVSDAVLTLGDTVDVRVEATNFGPRPIEISPSGCPQVYEVRDASGRIVGPERVFCPLIAYAPLELQPGESHTFEYRWAGASSDEEGTPVPAGTYRLQGWTWIVSSDGPLRSNVVELRVEAPPALSPLPPP